MFLNASLRICFIFAFSWFVQGTENNIAFDLSDLTRVIRSKTNREFQLEAFKSVNNDKIIQEGISAKYSRLFWVSLGYPLLLKTANRHTPSLHQIFHEQKNRFYTYIQTLTQEQRRLLLRTANTKYNMNVTTNQIVHLILQQFSCNIELFELGKRYLIKGEVSNFHDHPLRMDFTAPIGSRERRLFKKEIQLHRNDSSSIRLMCSVESPGQRTRVNTLTITSKSSQQIGINEKLFGPSTKEGDSVYVTRNQMNSLASELFSTLSIVEEYKIPEHEFSEAFVQEFIKQMAQKGFSQVSFEKAVSALSKFTLDISDDLKPDIIKRDMGQIFRIETTNNKSHIVVNEEQSETSKDKDTSSLDLSAKVGFLSIFETSASVKTAKENSQEWSKGIKSLKDQIHDLNRENTDKIEWTIEGTKVVPKSVNVAKIDQAKFGNTLRFARIRRYITDAPFKRKFSLYTDSSKLTDGFYEEELGKGISTSEKSTKVMFKKIIDVLKDSEGRRRKESSELLQMMFNKMVQLHNDSEVRYQHRDGDPINIRYPQSLPRDPINIKYPPPLPRMLGRLPFSDGYTKNILCTPRGDARWIFDANHIKLWNDILTGSSDHSNHSPAFILPTYLGGLVVQLRLRKLANSNLVRMEMQLINNDYNKAYANLPIYIAMTTYFFHSNGRLPVVVASGCANNVTAYGHWIKLFHVNKHLFTPGNSLLLDLLFRKPEEICFSRKKRIPVD